MTSILVITLFYPPHHYGGYEIACQSAVNGLVARGHTVQVLTADLELPDRGPDDPSAPVRRDLRPYVHDGELRRPSLPERFRTERHNQTALRRALEDAKPDVVSIWHFGALSHGLITTVRERGIPVVAVIADDWLIYGVNVDPWMSVFTSSGPRRIVGRAVERATGIPTHLPTFDDEVGVLFTSEDNRERSRRDGRLTATRDAISYLGIDTGAFTGVRADAEPGLLLYAGRCDPRKGIGTVIDALTSLPDHRLEIRAPDGDGTHGDELRARADDAGVGDRVDWRPAVDQQDLAARMAAAEAVVFPSLWAEPFGLVPLEAMACGTPVIATGVGGSGEFLVDGTNCLRYPPGDEAALVAAVRRLAEDADGRSRVVAGGHRTAAFFSRDNFTDVVERWHVAAADGFPDGTPEGRSFDPGLTAPT